MIIGFITAIMIVGGSYFLDNASVPEVKKEQTKCKCCYKKVHK